MPTYRNPVWPGEMADPFVLHWRGEYFAYGTARPGPRSTGAFPILRSLDLVKWEPAGYAVAWDGPRASRDYWAPEVAEHRGKFYLYYSSAPTGQDAEHRLRVAIADRPIGPFVDAGLVLPESEGFGIDANPFRDPRDHRWYLFFARDFFDARTGTALAVVELDRELCRAAGPAHTVLRPNADWQIYQRNRRHYERDWPAWHTVEGPCVVPHEGRYYCFYSGGNWQTEGYGVSYAVADHPLGPWEHAADAGPAILRQKPGEVIGPGHNSYVVAPNGVEVIVYHAWDPARTIRRMCLDRLIWTDDGPRCVGPTTLPQTWW